MHSGASVAQPCLACGAGRETRTPTPKRWYLKPMRLPIPPYPHVGRRYVTMFRKGQARLIAAFRFLRTFLIPAPVAGAGRALRLFATRAGEQGATAGQRRFGAENGKPHRLRLSSPSRPTSPGASHAGRRRNRQYLCGYIDIIYSAPRSPVTGLPAPAPDQRLRGFRTLAPPLIRSSLTPSHSRTPDDHQKHTNWSQIMHESPQSACFTGLHCNLCIGDILLCLFLF